MMVCVGPIGYATAIFMIQNTKWHKWLKQKPELERTEPLLDSDHDSAAGTREGRDHDNLKDVEQGDTDAIFKRGAAHARKLPTHLPNPPVLEFYHFLPIARYYLLLKEPHSGDVEGLFRVNALSTFTFGFAQMTCLIMGLSSGVL